MSNNQPAENQPIQVKVSDTDLKGFYANMVQIGHTGEEFVLDFMNIFPPAGVLGSRIVMSPGHAKRVMEALNNNIQNFEKSFGKIKVSDQPDKKIGFRTE